MYILLLYNKLQYFECIFKKKLQKLNILILRSFCITTSFFSSDYLHCSNSLFHISKWKNIFFAASYFFLFDQKTKSFVSRNSIFRMWTVVKVLPKCLFNTWSADGGTLQELLRFSPFLVLTDLKLIGKGSLC